MADTVTKVTLAVRDETIPFVRIAHEAECRLSLDGAVTRDDGAVVCYLGGGDGEGAPAETLRDRAAVTDVRWIRSKEEPLLQVTIADEMPVTALTAWWATVRPAQYTADSARLVAEAPPEGDVRRMVEAVDDTATGTTLVSKEERTRTADTAEVFYDALEERRTDRQRTVLRTAHLSDYFTFPMEHVGGGGRDAGHRGSTMLYHLRRAQQELVDAFFEAEGGPPRPTATGDRSPAIGRSRRTTRATPRPRGAGP